MVDDIHQKINGIENDLFNLNNYLTDVNNLIDENNNKLIRLTNKYNRETKYVLFNILTNEYMNIKCEFQKLKKIIECLIYSKYINDKPITNEDFIKINKNIYKLYFKTI